MKRGSLKLGDVPSYPALLEAVKRAWSDVLRGKFNARDLALTATLIFTVVELAK